MKIKILSVVPGTPNLVLSDKGSSTVKKSLFCKSITWEIPNTDEIDSFWIQAKRPGRTPFEEPIPKTFEKKVKLKLANSADFFVWDYAIHWKDKKGTYTFDPKISIKPNRSDPAGFLIALLLSSLIAFFTLQFMFKKFKK